MYPCIPRLLLGFFYITLNEMGVCKKSWGGAREKNHNYTPLCIIMLGAHYLALLCGKLYTQAFILNMSTNCKISYWL